MSQDTIGGWVALLFCLERDVVLSVGDGGCMEGRGGEGGGVV